MDKAQTQVKWAEFITQIGSFLNNLRKFEDEIKVKREEIDDLQVRKECDSVLNELGVTQQRCLLLAGKVKVKEMYLNLIEGE